MGGRITREAEGLFENSHHVRTVATVAKSDVAALAGRLGRRP